MLSTNPTPQETKELYETLRDARPHDDDHLWNWISGFTGVRIARAPVCVGHRPPFDWVRDVWEHRLPQALILGPRGGGKSFLGAILTHLESRFHPRHGTRILGGSRAQSLQVYEAITSAIIDGQGSEGSDAESLEAVLESEARYRNGSRVSVLAASSTSVRGPHVATLRLDEVDEIDPDLRDAAFGMVMAKNGVQASVTMTSTWHRVGGPMSGLMDQARAGLFPVYASCAFEVLERCPGSRSGPWVGGDAGYERCPECPLKPWCHAERDRNGGIPLAKLSDGHYAIASLIQKVHGVSRRSFESEYLCKGPRADGHWFKDFDATKNVTPEADYDPALPVHVAIDSGVFTAATAFQIRGGSSGRPVVTVFMDYLSEGVASSISAQEIVDRLAGRDGVSRKVSTDPSGGSRNPVGPTVLAEYERAGLRGLVRWPVGSISDSLALVESLISPAGGPPALLIHPRCRSLIVALENYRRARRGGQWQDYPEDPQHPHEDLVDALRGGLKTEFPEGLRNQNTLRRVHARSVF